MNMQTEIQRQAEVIRSMDEPPEPPFSGSRPYFSNLSLDNAPVSPRQMPQDDPRRGTAMGVAPRQNFYRPPVPSHLSITPRRYGSIGASTSQFVSFWFWAVIVTMALVTQKGTSDYE